MPGARVLRMAGARLAGGLADKSCPRGNLIVYKIRQLCLCPSTMPDESNHADQSCGELSCDECNARTAALIAERDQLQAWKDSALALEREWDQQALAKMLGGTLGHSCRKIINEKVPLLIAERDQLRAEVRKLQEQIGQQLAACDCAAMMDTPETHEKNKTVTRENPFWSPAFESVMRRTAECIALRAEVERLKKDNMDFAQWIACKMMQPEWDSFKKSMEVVDHWKSRAERAEAELAKVEKAYTDEVQRRFKDVDALSAELAKARARFSALRKAVEPFVAVVFVNPEDKKFRDAAEKVDAIDAAMND